MGVKRPDSDSEEVPEEEEEEEKRKTTAMEKGRQTNEEEEQVQPEGIDDLLGLGRDEPDFKPRKQREVATDTLISFDDDDPTPPASDLTSDLQPSSLSKVRSSPRAERNKAKPMSQGYGSTGYGSTGYGSIGYGSIGGTSSSVKEKSSSSGLDDWNTDSWGEGWGTSDGVDRAKKTSANASDGWDNDDWSSDGWGKSSGWSDVDLRTKSD